MHLSISEASIYLGVSCCTLRRWDKVSKLTPDSLTPGRHRRYSLSNLKCFSGLAINAENKKVIAYSRVSSHDQKEDLKRQSLVLNVNFHRPPLVEKKRTLLLHQFSIPKCET